MKSLSVTPSTIDFGKQSVGNKRSQSVLITNTGTENCELTGIATKGSFSSDLVSKTIPPAYPASSTIYFTEIAGKKVLQNADGSYQTTDLGYGIAGTTDSEGELYFGMSAPSIPVFNMSAIAGVYNIANAVYFYLYCETTGVSPLRTIEVQYSTDETTWTTIKERSAGTITQILLDSGTALGSGFLRLRIKGTDIVSATKAVIVVTPAIVFDEITPEPSANYYVTGTCNLPVNVKISYSVSPFTTWYLVDESISVQPDGTFTSTVENRVADTYRYKVAYYQDSVVEFANTYDVVVASGATGTLTMNATCVASPPEDA